MSEKREEKLYIDDILESIKAIQSFIKNTDYATLRELEIIGEAISKLSKKTKNQNQDIDFRTIKDFRNILTHEYFGVNSLVVWDIAQTELPLLKEQITSIKI